MPTWQPADCQKKVLVTLSVAEMALGMIDAVRETGKRFDETRSADRHPLRGSGRWPHRSAPVDLRRLGRYGQRSKPPRVHRLAQPYSNIGEHLPTSQGWVQFRVARSGRIEGEGYNA